MATAVPVSSGLRHGRAPKWIISERDDLVYFVFSVLATYAVLAANVMLGVPAVALLWVWMIVFDGPHVFGTLSRTYLDATWIDDNRRLALLSLLWIPLGPLAVLAGLGTLFFTFAPIWGFYHPVKQHYGFMVLYKKRNDDLSPVDNAIDKAFLFTGVSYPFVVFFGKAFSTLVQDRDPIISPAMSQALLAVTLATFVVYLVRQVYKATVGLPMNWPKQFLLAAVIPMHWMVFFSRIDPIAISPALTVFHNIQYQRLVWHYNRRKYFGHPHFGLAEHLSRNFSTYLAFGILFNAIYHVPWKLSSGSNPSGLWASFFWGFAFIHYYLDSKIWRVRHDPALAQSLGF
jgi:hypothetical protein